MEQKKTILVVEDEETLRLLLKETLEYLGYNVYQASNGREAVKLYSDIKDKVDLIILDMVMPEMNGEETFYKLREINPNARIILSSGYSVDEKTRELIGKGALGFIQKPYRVDEIEKALKKVLN